MARRFAIFNVLQECECGIKSTIFEELVYYGARRARFETSNPNVLG